MFPWPRQGLCVRVCVRVFVTIGVTSSLSMWRQVNARCVSHCLFTAVTLSLPERRASPYLDLVLWGGAKPAVHVFRTQVCSLLHTAN